VKANRSVTRLLKSRPRLSFLTFPPEVKMLVVKSSIETKVLQEKRDETLAESDNLPDPDVLAQEIVDLEAAPEQFREIANDLRPESSETRIVSPLVNLYFAGCLFLICRTRGHFAVVIGCGAAQSKTVTRSWIVCDHKL
jgi:hypothetical protein